MKRISIIVLTLILLWGFAGCKGTKTMFSENNSSIIIASNDTVQSGESISAEKPNESSSPTTQKRDASDGKTNNTDTINPTESKNTDTPITIITPEEKTEIPYSMELKMLGNLQYYLYTPSNPKNDMPLIVYLHGGTNKKADASALLTTDGFPQYLYDGYYGNLRAYVIIPKLNNQYKGWSDISDQIKELIKTIHINYHIDRNKISLTGHSMGGTGTYQLQIKLPDTFACIAPASGSIQNNEMTQDALSKTKIWAFVGTEDTIVNPDSSREMIRVLHEKGANAKITELNGATHFDVPALVYKNNSFIDWLIRCGE